MTTTLKPLNLSEADDSLLEGTFLDLAEKSSSDESVAVAAVVSSTFCNTLYRSLEEVRQFSSSSAS